MEQRGCCIEPHQLALSSRGHREYRACFLADRSPLVNSGMALASSSAPSNLRPFLFGPRLPALNYLLRFRHDGCRAHAQNFPGRGSDLPHPPRPEPGSAS